MRISLLRVAPWLVLAGFALAGCQADQEAPAKAIEAYLASKVESNVDEMTRLSCPAFEAQAQIEATSFASMARSWTQRTTARPTATTRWWLHWKITTTYQGEARVERLDHPYRALNDGGGG
jgi:hypothetical protein